MKHLLNLLPSGLAFGLALLVFSCQTSWAQNWNTNGGYQAPSNQYQSGQMTGQMQNQYGMQNQYSGQQQYQQQNQYGNQMQGQYGAQRQNNQQTYYGQAQQSQPAPSQNQMGSVQQIPQNSNSGNMYGSQNGTQQTSPGSYIDYSDSNNQLSGSAKTTGGRSKGSMIKGAAGGMANVLGKSLKVAAPVAGSVAGAYMLNKAAQRTGYYQQNPYGYGAANPYGYGAVNPYGYGAANPYGYGAVNPYGGGAYNPYGGANYGTPYYPQQQSVGNSLLNTGLRALFGGGN